MKAIKRGRSFESAILPLDEWYLKQDGFKEPTKKKTGGRVALSVRSNDDMGVKELNEFKVKEIKEIRLDLIDL